MLQVVSRFQGEKDNANMPSQAYELILVTSLSQAHPIPWDQSSSLKPLDIKHHIISVLRYEMRWMAKKSMKEFEVIFRTDSELADKVSMVMLLKTSS